MLRGRWRVQKLTVAGQEGRCAAVLAAGRWGRGLGMWRIDGELDEMGEPPDEGIAVVETSDGRRLRGPVIRKNFRITSNRSGVRATFEYLGAGALHELDEAT